MPIDAPLTEPCFVFSLLLSGFSMKFLSATATFLLLLLLTSSFLQAAMAGTGKQFLQKKISSSFSFRGKQLCIAFSFIFWISVSAFCEAKCKVRCAKAGMMDRCLHYCGMCCEECKCVPSGTYGNKDECPCYRDKVANNDKTKPKCPWTPWSYPVVTSWVFNWFCS